VPEGRPSQPNRRPPQMWFQCRPITKPHTPVNRVVHSRETPRSVYGRAGSISRRRRRLIAFQDRPLDACAIALGEERLRATATHRAALVPFLRSRIGWPYIEVFQDFGTLAQRMAQRQARDQHLADRDRDLSRSVRRIDHDPIAGKIILWMRRRRECRRKRNARERIGCDIAKQPAAQPASKIDKPIRRATQNTPQPTVPPTNPSATRLAPHVPNPPCAKNAARSRLIPVRARVTRGPSRIATNGVPHGCDVVPVNAGT
jgi:hypothetical protein